ncbi:MAG TPA: carboxypeptidase-like regulatory domain-containing protein [Terriglobia bacterium]|nr:carboxypeptidase-like regulatory domain-containing protein [Terriglobia bacterium]
MHRWISLCAILLLFSSLALAQDTATIIGTVTDPSGAVIPNAKVTVSNPAKGYVRHLVADSAGLYQASALPIGDFVVTAEAPGFRKLVRSGIHLQVGQLQRVDLKLQVGQATQEITITGNVPHVQTETASISGVVTGREIENLDLNGRNFVTLATLVPGAVPAGGLDTTSVGVMGNNNISFNGNRTQYSNWEIDGGNNTDEGSASTLNTYPDLDSISEFRITTSNYGADIGRHAGAVIEVATRSGTKDFHGDAFEYVRNDAFDANPFFLNRILGVPNAPKSPLKWNDYGYTLGGPLYIPGHYNTDKSKTFFFFSEEWRAYREGTVINAGVPSLRMRNGDFSECDTASPNFNAIVASGCNVPNNPVTGKAFNGDTVPIDPNANGLLNGFFPLPNNGPDTYTAAPSVPTNWRQEQIRIDQNVSDKTQMFLRYTQDAWNQTTIPALWSWSSYDTVNTRFAGPGKSAVLHIVHTFTPTLMNEFIMAYTVDHIALFPVAGLSSPAHSIDKPSGWNVPSFFAPNRTNPLLPGIVVCGGSGSTCMGEDQGNERWFNSNPVITWKDNVALIHGNHSLKTGFFLEKYRKNEQFGADTQGYMQFANWGSNTTGNALADMYLGRMAQYTEGTQTVHGVPVGGYPKGHWRMTDFEPYIQDDWKATPRLTFNLGMRYYLFVPIHDVSTPQTVDANFLPNLYNPADQAQLINTAIGPTIVPGTGAYYANYGNGLVECGSGGIPSGCRFPFYSTFGPRFGFAWDPTGRGTTVLRGGYGVYYDAGNGNEANTEGAEGNSPVALSPSGFNITGFQSIAPGLVGPGGFSPIPPYQGYPQAQSFSLNFQHSFSSNDLFSLAYVGTLGRDLASQVNLNELPIGLGNMTVPALAGLSGCNAQGVCPVQQVLINQQQPSAYFAPYRGFSTIGMKGNWAYSSYNALQADFRHTMAQGLTLEVAYTWSHALDNSSTTYFQGSNPGGVETYDMNRWYGTSDLNRAQVLNINYVYNLPFFKNSTNHFVRNVIGGWTVSGITTFFTGLPIDFGCGVGGFGTGIGGSVRCNSAGAVGIDKHVVNDPTFGPTLSWYNPALITQPLQSQLYANNEPGMFGYMGRNFLTGPGRNNWDMALLKDFTAPWFNGEHSTIQFRWETFNTFNHTQWNGVNAGCLSTTSFGQPCTGVSSGALLGEVNSAYDPRLVQFALKFIF